jgi:hypothetical protein
MFRARTSRLLPVVLAASALAGCDAPPRGSGGEARSTAADPHRPTPNPFDEAPRPQAPKPDLALLSYDPGNRKLTLYPLPNRSARWMISLPTAQAGVPVDREYEFPPGLDLDLNLVAVYYTVPNRRPSPAVSLREILEARGVPVVR